MMKLPTFCVTHIERMTDGTGIFQHALYSVPDYHHGYCTDDNARALILCDTPIRNAAAGMRERLDALASKYLAFLASALHPDSGRFRNFMGHSRAWLEPHGSEDSHGRALWALGHGAAHSNDRGRKRLSAQTFDYALEVVRDFHSPRAWAFSLLGIHCYLQAHPDHIIATRMRDDLVEKLLSLWHAHSSENWQWFEPIAAYDNARLCQALLLSGTDAKRSDVVTIGLCSLRWLLTIQKSSEGYFRPVGSDGFYPQGGEMAQYDQQPVEAQAMVAACLTAYRITKNSVWLEEANVIFSWFTGWNDLHVSLYDAATGGCCDGLHPTRVNENQGAESTLAFHLSLADIETSISQTLPL